MNRKLRKLSNLFISLLLCGQFYMPIYAQEESEIEETITEEVNETIEDPVDEIEEPIKETENPIDEDVPENNDPEFSDEIYFETEIEEIITESRSDAINPLNNELSLKEGNYTRYIDRLEVNQEAIDFYNELESIRYDPNSFLMEPLLEQYKTDQGSYAKNIAHLVFTESVDPSEVSQDGINQALEKYRDYCSKLSKQYQMVYSAFMRDHPEIFWLGSVIPSVSTSIGGSYNPETSEYVFTFDMFLNLDTNMIERSLYSNVQSIQNEIERYNQGIAVARNYIDTHAKSNSPYHILLAMNDWIVDENEYNIENTNASIAHNCMSGLYYHTGSNSPVCEGYAKTMKILCDAYNIPCVLESGYATNSSGNGEGHMWCLVQIDDAWYAIDPTWNDPVMIGGGTQPRTSRMQYFLVGSNTAIDGVNFGVSHPSSNDVTSTYYYLNGPVLSNVAYVYVDKVLLKLHYKNGNDVISDKEISLKLSDIRDEIIRNEIEKNVPNGYLIQNDLNVSTSILEYDIEVTNPISGYSLTLSGDISMNVYFPTSVNDKFDRVEMELNGNTKSYAFTELEICDKGLKLCIPMSAKEMMDDIIVRVVDKNNQVVEEKSISIDAYSQSILNGNFDENDKKVIECLLTYGKYAQIYFDYNTDHLPTIDSELKCNDTSLIENSFAYKETGKNDSVTFVGARLVLKNKPGLKLYFINNGAELICNDGSVSEEGKYQVVTFMDINDLKQEKVVTTDDGYKLTYSVYSYIQKAFNTQNTDLNNLVKAMSNYYFLFL